MEETKLKPGLYYYDGEERDVFFVVDVKETNEFLKLKMIENSSYFTPNHFDMMFHGKTTCSLRKEKCPHKVNKSGDDWFCVYPQRAGVPYPFRFMPNQEQYVAPAM